MTLMEEEHWPALPESPSPAAMLDMPGAASYAAGLAKIQYPLPSSVWRTSISVVIPSGRESLTRRGAHRGVPPPRQAAVPARRGRSVQGPPRAAGAGAAAAPPAPKRVRARTRGWGAGRARDAGGGGGAELRAKPPVRS